MKAALLALSGVAVGVLVAVRAPVWREALGKNWKWVTVLASIAMLGALAFYGVQRYIQNAGLGYYCDAYSLTLRWNESEDRFAGEHRVEGHSDANSDEHQPLPPLQSYSSYRIAHFSEGRFVGTKPAEPLKRRAGLMVTMLEYGDRWLRCPGAFTVIAPTHVVVRHNLENVRDTVLENGDAGVIISGTPAEGNYLRVVIAEAAFRNPLLFQLTEVTLWNVLGYALAMLGGALLVPFALARKEIEESVLQPAIKRQLMRLGILDTK